MHIHTLYTSNLVRGEAYIAYPNQIMTSHAFRALFFLFFQLSFHVLSKYFSHIHIMRSNSRYSPYKPWFYPLWLYYRFKLNNIHLVLMTCFYFTLFKCEQKYLKCSISLYVGKSIFFLISCSPNQLKRWYTPTDLCCRKKAPGYLISRNVLKSLQFIKLLLLISLLLLFTLIYSCFNYWSSLTIIILSQFSFHSL